MKTFVSAISKKEFPESERIFARTIRKSIFDFILKDHPGFTQKSMISVAELNLYRQKYLSAYLVQEVGELSHLEEDVLKTIADQESMATKANTEIALTNFTYGQRLADKIASFGGSWKFIILFGSFIFVWITINLLYLSSQAFDPYPFILLNLLLSCLAALQAPVIMMSQNRQEEKDRERARADYMVNLKAELEIRTLH